MLLLSLLTDRIDADLMDAIGPQLKIISNYAVGFDNVDVKAASDRGIIGDEHSLRMKLMKQLRNIPGLLFSHWPVELLKSDEGRQRYLPEGV